MSVRDDFKAQYKRAEAELAAHDAKVAPLVAERDALQGQYEPKLRDLNQRIRKAQEPRFDMQTRLKYLAGALGGSVE